MPEDEFFKRMAETLVVDEPASERPRGTAERRVAQVKQRVVTDEASGVEPEPREEPGHRNGSDLAKQESGARDDRVETTGMERRWVRAHPLALFLSMMGVVGVGVGAILGLGGSGAPPLRREVPPIMEPIASPPPGPPRIQTPARTRRPKIRKRPAVRAPKSSSVPESDRQSEDAPVAAGQIISGGSKRPTGGERREGFGFEDGSP
jgi:hypothetical protein